jgi:hypothetical protein
MKTASLPIWSSATLMSWISSGFTTAIASESRKPQSCERSNPSCSNSAMVSHFAAEANQGGRFYIDLLLYHRKLRRIVAVDLKLEIFRPEHAGQMEFYLRWLAKHEQQPHEESPLGLILCSAKLQEWLLAKVICSCRSRSESAEGFVKDRRASDPGRGNSQRRSKLPDHRQSPF